MSKFPNKMAGQFANEIAEANSAALNAGLAAPPADDGHVGQGPGPYAASHDENKWFPTKGFRRLVQSGSKFKWTLNTRGDMGAISSTLKHAVAAGGGEVWTAGHGTYNAGNNTLTLDNDTGHYETSEESLGRSREAWEYMGYNVVFQARQDFAAALNKLAF